MRSCRGAAAHHGGSARGAVRCGLTRAVRADAHESRSNSSRGSSPGRTRTLSESGLLDGPVSLDKDKLVAHLLGNFNQTNAPRERIDRRNSDTELRLLPLAVLSQRRATWS